MTAVRDLGFLLGLPALRDGALWRTARRMDAPVLISANALSRWRTDIIGLRQWTGFETRWPHLVAHHPVALDPAGFVAASRYRGFPWGVDEYLDLAANPPWLWWASMDWCVEPEIAHDEDAILDRISGTVRLNIQCLNGADRRGIADRFVPVIQGWHPEQYLRCLERMPFALDFPLVGIGSMCRRHVEGEYGILHVLDVLDRAFNGSETRFHLFGLKSQGMSAARTHPRVASCDSQAYGVTARQEARKRQCGKPDTLVAAVMEDWFAQQTTLMATKATVRRPTSWPSRSKRIPPPEIDARVAAAMEQLRALHEAGEIDWGDVSPLHAFQMAFLADDHDPESDDAVTA